MTASVQAYKRFDVAMVIDLWYDVQKIRYEERPQCNLKERSTNFRFVN